MADSTAPPTIAAALKLFAPFSRMTTFVRLGTLIRETHDGEDRLDDQGSVADDLQLRRRLPVPIQRVAFARPLSRRRRLRNRRGALRQSEARRRALRRNVRVARRDSLRRRR